MANGHLRDAGSDVVSGGDSVVVSGNSGGVDGNSGAVDGKLDVVVDDKSGNVDGGRRQSRPLASNETTYSMNKTTSREKKRTDVCYNEWNYWQEKCVAGMSGDVGKLLGCKKSGDVHAANTYTKWALRVTLICKG